MAHRVAREAEADLDEIWYFIATQSSSPDVAALPPRQTKLPEDE